jgi:hypothetical protein
MPRRWHIDECNTQWVSGWIDDEGPVDAITIAVNGREIATLAPTVYREDLEAAGIGDGRRSFRFPISRHLVGTDDSITISHRGEVLHSSTLRAGDIAGASGAGQSELLLADPVVRRRRPGAPLLEGAVRLARKEVVSTEACDFYHVVDLPDGTTTRGPWDLRRSAGEYLGNVDFAGKCVIEIGPASGFLSFHMEGRGAQVAVIEPPMESFWDLVPQSTLNPAEARKLFAAHIERIRNSFWYLHTGCDSRVESYEVDAYRIPRQSHPFDIGVLASVLLHVSSPVRMLESLAAVVADRIIIVERYFPDLANQPVSRLVPSVVNRSRDTWWEFSPRFFAQYLAVLGFPNHSLTHHRQFYAITNQPIDMFTLVASR